MDDMLQFYFKSALFSSGQFFNIILSEQGHYS